MSATRSPAVPFEVTPQLLCDLALARGSTHAPIIWTAAGNPTVQGDQAPTQAQLKLAYDGPKSRPGHVLSALIPVQTRYGPRDRWVEIASTVDLQLIEQLAPVHPQAQRDHGAVLHQALQDQDRWITGPSAQLEQLYEHLLDRIGLVTGPTERWDVADDLAHAWRRAGAAGNDHAAGRWLVSSLPEDLQRTLDPVGADRVLIAQSATAARTTHRLDRALEGVRTTPTHTLDRSPALSR